MSTRKVPLADLCDLEIGKTPSRSNPEYWRNGSLPWLSIADMNQGRELKHTKECITESGATAARMRLVQPGTLLLSYKLSIGKVGFARVPMYTNEAIAALSNLSSDVEPDFMFWAIQNVDLLRGADRAAMGATLNKAKLSKVEIPLPPLPEQRRIAAILDKADALRAKRRAAIAKLDQLLQSVFLDMFGDPVTNPKADVVALSELCVRITDGTHQSPTWAEAGVPFLFQSNVKPYEIDLDTRKSISEDEYEQLTARCPIESGDVLFTIVGSYGNAAMIRTKEKFCFQRHIAHLKPKVDVMPEFLEAMLNQKSIKRQADERVTGIAQKTLILRELRALKVLKPRLENQRAFAEIAKGVRRQKGMVERHLHLKNLMFSALQHRAFSGAL